jgi:hypothetical protein
MLERPPSNLLLRHPLGTRPRPDGIVKEALEALANERQERRCSPSEMLALYRPPNVQCLARRYFPPEPLPWVNGKELWAAGALARAPAVEEMLR